MKMELKSSTVSTIGEVGRAILTAVLVFILLKTFECLVLKVLLISPRGRLSPQIWARSVLLSEAWDPNALLRLLLGRTRYDAAGGVKMGKRRPSKLNVVLLSVFILTVLLAEVTLLYGSLESEKEVRADSIKLQFQHTGLVAGSEDVAKKGCQWADVQGRNFKLTARLGVCWAAGNGDSQGLVVGSGPVEERAEVFVKQYDSAVHIEVHYSGPRGGSVTKAYLAAIIIGSSGLSSRVKMESNTTTIIQRVIEQQARSRDCNVTNKIRFSGIESCSTDFDFNTTAGKARLRDCITKNSRNFTAISSCSEDLDFKTTDELLRFVSGGFSLVQGSISPWDGNITSTQGSASDNVIGLESRSRIGLLTLSLITLGALILRLGAHFLPGDNEKIAMKIVMERIGGNYCTEDATACVGEQITLITSTGMAGETVVGNVSTYVPSEFTEVRDLKNVNNVRGTEDPSTCDGEQISLFVSVDNTTKPPTGHVGTTLPEGYTQVESLTGLNVKACKSV